MQHSRLASQLIVVTVVQSAVTHQMCIVACSFISCWVQGCCCTTFVQFIGCGPQISVLLHACVPCKEGVMTATRVGIEVPTEI